MFSVLRTVKKHISNLECWAFPKEMIRLWTIKLTYVTFLLEQPYSPWPSSISLYASIGRSTKWLTDISLRRSGLRKKWGQRQLCKYRYVFVYKSHFFHISRIGFSHLTSFHLDSNRGSFVHCIGEGISSCPMPTSYFLTDITKSVLQMNCAFQ